MFFWYERTVTGIWAAQLSDQAPGPVAAGNTKRKLGRVHDVTEFLQDWKGPKAPTLNDLTLAFPAPVDEAPVPKPVVAEAPAAPSIPTLTYSVRGGVIEMTPSGGLFAEDLSYGSVREPGEAVEAWLTRIAPKGTVLIQHR